MAASSYENALHAAESLSREEQLRLIRELAEHSGKDAPLERHASVLELCGLGQEVWQQVDAQEYVRRERASWNG